MASGDAKIAMSSIGATSYWTVQPSGTEVWRIFNVSSTSWTGGAGTISTEDSYPNVRLESYNGTQYWTAMREARVMMGFSGGNGSWDGFPVWNAQYMRLYNTAGTTQTLVYSGIQVR